MPIPTMEVDVLATFAELYRQSMLDTHATATKDMALMELLFGPQKDAFLSEHLNSRAAMAPLQFN